MTLLDAKDVKDLVAAQWNIIPVVKGSIIERIVNGSFEDGDTGWVANIGSVYVNTDLYRTGTHSVFLYEQRIKQTLSSPIPVKNITSFKCYISGYPVGMHTGGCGVTIYYSDLTSINISAPDPSPTWTLMDMLASLDISKTVIAVEPYGGTGDMIHLDDISLLAIESDGTIALTLDEYNPNDPLYQIVFINRPERIMFVAPNVIKHEQDIVVEIHVKHIRMDPDNVDSKRIIFKSVKGELSRIFNTYRFDEVGNVLNVSAWSDNKLPHGFGMEADPLELVTRLTLQIFYYEATDGTKIGLRVSKVTILDSDLLGLVDAQFIDTNPWVHMQIPKGPLLEQHLLGPHIDGEITTHDYASLYELLYQIPIVEGSVKYPILIDGTKLVFSTVPNNPQFTIVLKDDDGTEYTYYFYNVRIKQVELQRTNTSGTSEARWRITWMADYVYYTAGGN